MARCGIPAIDVLFEGGDGVAPICADSPPECVCALQDLLRAQGYSQLPGPMSHTYGRFGPKTRAAIASFRAALELPASDVIDAEALRKLIETPGRTPIASRPYVTLGLDLEWSGLSKVVLVTAMLEGQGAFTALNRNTDKAGLSFGIIQWAQKPGRLAEILRAFHDADETEFVRIFGGGKEARAAGLLSHVRRPKGGVDPATGRSRDPQYELTEDRWVESFTEAGRAKAFQRVQIQTAVDAFRQSLVKIRKYAPGLRTEREVGFMLDVANQYGDAGARAIWEDAMRGAPANVLRQVAEISVQRIAPQFREAVAHRRKQFLETPALSDEEFREV